MQGERTCFPYRILKTKVVEKVVETVVVTVIPTQVPTEAPSITPLPPPTEVPQRRQLRQPPNLLRPPLLPQQMPAQQRNHL
jgi:hypothetical protein